MPSVVSGQMFDRDSQLNSNALQAFPNAFTAGNSVYITVQISDTTQSPTISDDGGNTYDLLVGPVTLVLTRYWIFRAKNVNASRPNITLNPGGTSDVAQFAGWEVNGDDPASPIDPTQFGGEDSKSGTDASPTSNALTVANANDLILATIWTPGFGRSATLNSSFTHIEGSQGPWGSVGYKTETGKTFTETGTLSSATRWYFITIPIKGPSASGGPFPFLMNTLSGGMRGMGGGL